jgi:L-threonylcarbamoyladenylate synthase
MAVIGTDIELAVAMIREGRLVALPTDTIYGLATDALNEKAVEEIYITKNRPLDKPIIAMIGDFDHLNEICQNIEFAAKKLADKYWPGALTMVFDAKSNVPSILLAKGSTLGVRIPNHPMTLKILNRFNSPLAVTSANITDQANPKTAKEVNDQIGDKIDYILDGGPSQIGLESTIIKFENNNPKIIRLGAITEAEIISTLHL